jgi:hypothetical protein
MTMNNTIQNKKMSSTSSNKIKCSECGLFGHNKRTCKTTTSSVSSDTSKIRQRKKGPRKDGPRNRGTGAGVDKNGLYGLY